MYVSHTIVRVLNESASTQKSKVSTPPIVTANINKEVQQTYRGFGLLYVAKYSLIVLLAVWDDVRTFMATK
jgi:hypothetical protein